MLPSLRSIYTIIELGKIVFIPDQTTITYTSFFFQWLGTPSDRAKEPATQVVLSKRRARVLVTDAFPHILERVWNLHVLTPDVGTSTLLHGSSDAKIPLVETTCVKDGTVYAVARALLRSNFARTFGAKKGTYHFAKVKRRTFTTYTARQVAFGNRNRHSTPSLVGSLCELTIHLRAGISCFAAIFQLCFFLALRARMLDDQLIL